MLDGISPDTLAATAAGGAPYLVFGMILGSLLACLAIVIAWDRFGRDRGDGGEAGHAD